MAVVDYFLKIDGIDGESQDAIHKGEIEVESFSFGLSNTGRAGAAGSGGGAGKVAFQDFHFTAVVSKASPNLMLACAAGQHIKSATLTGRLAGKAELEFMTLKLSDVLVSGFQDGGSIDGAPLDQVTLNFAKVEFGQRAGNPDGTLAAPLVQGWDIAVNKTT
jgi:type VI secretion system secreted protein Hcp